MRFALRAFCGILLLGSGRLASAQTNSGALDTTAYQQRAASIFSPAGLATPSSELSVACDRLLILMQAVSAVMVVAGMILRLRRDHEQMEGVASMMLKVAFIATVPFWREFTLESADAMADAVGYRAASVDATPSSTVTRMWDLAAQWLPPSTPALDALDSQSGTNFPASGEELNWSLQAWNWARGVGEPVGSAFHAMWQSTSGGLRAAFVLGGTGIVSTGVLIAICLSYLAEMLRYFLYAAGCAMLPILIAGLGIDALRPAALRAIISLLSIAVWPVGWALANCVSNLLVGGTVSWISSTTAAALGAASDASDVLPLAVAAPQIAWSTLFLFGAITIVVCLWIVGTTILIPFVLARGAAVGGQFVTRWTTAASSSAISVYGSGAATPVARAGPAAIVPPVRASAIHTPATSPPGGRARR